MLMEKYRASQLLNIPMPFGFGLVRSFILSPRLLTSYRCGQPAPITVPKGTQHYFVLLLTPFLIEPVIVHLCAALRLEVCVTPYFILILLLHFCSHRTTSRKKYYTKLRIISL